MMCKTHMVMHRRGVALIVVLVLVVMIALAGFGFANSMGTEYEATKIAGDELQADQALLSAEALVAQYLQLPTQQQLALGGHFDNETMFRGRAVLGDPERSDAPDGAARRSASDDAWQFSVLAAPGGGQEDSLVGEARSVRFGLVNESNKLHLGAILAWDRAKPGAGRAVLTKLPRVTPEVADAILDWLDPDTTPREFGAEAEFYDALARPYRVANRLPKSLDELRLVRGVTATLLYGLDSNRNFRVDRSEQQLSSRAGLSSATEPIDEATESLGLVDFLTLHSAGRNANRTGEPRVDLNQIDLPTLLLQLQTRLPEDVAKFIILYRQYGPSPGSGGSLVGQITLDMTKPWQFKLNSVAELVDARIRIAADSPTTIRSPLRTDSAELHELLPLLLSETTTNPALVLAGQLNVNSAPEAVLKAVPFLSDDTVQQIVSQRDMLDDQTLASVAWLLTENVLSRDTFAQVQPWLTAGGNVFACQLFAFRGSRGPIRRVHVVFDAASAKPRRLEWVDLRSRGRGFSWNQVSRINFESDDPLSELLVE